MGARPQPSDVTNMAQHDQSWLLSPSLELGFWNRGGIVWIRRPREQELDSVSLGAEQPVGRDKVAEAFVGEHPADIGGGYWGWRLRQADQRLRVDARARDHPQLA